jgi:hypothetical protein
MALAANSSNNTVYADADGHIAYFHPQFVPRRGGSSPGVAAAYAAPRLRRAHAGEGLERIGHLTIERYPSVGDDRLGFVVREHPWAAPLRILVDQLPRRMSPSSTRSTRRTVQKVADPELPAFGGSMLAIKHGNRGAGHEQRRV